MIIDKKHINEIKLDFSNMQNSDDFVDLLNKVNKFLYKDKVRTIQSKQIYYHAFYADKNYYQFSILKKSGGTRTINAPNKSLKNILGPLNIILQSVYTPNKSAHGFIWEKSIVTNAKDHIAKNYIYNIDLENFFPNIHQARVWKRLQLEPFNLKNDKRIIANLIAGLTCFRSEDENKNILPQGAPTSPVISNFICERLDRRLRGLSKRFNVYYTRYADDITFSSMHNVYQKDGEFIKELNRIIHSQNFKINPDKTRLQKQGYRQEVTGLIVNKKVNVTRKYLKNLRLLIHLIEKYKLEKAQLIFDEFYPLEKTNPSKKGVKIENVISGKLEFLKMVKGIQDPTYVKLKERFVTCFMQKDKDSEKKEDLGNTKRNLVDGTNGKPLKYFSPKGMVNFFTEFNQNSILKPTTHAIDSNTLKSLNEELGIEEYNFKKHKEAIKKTFESIAYKYRKPPSVYSICEAYLIGEKHKEWSDHKITLNWFNKELSEWCIDNPGKVPDPYSDLGYKGYTFDTLKLKNGTKLNSFNDIVRFFKGKIWFRKKDRTDLKSLIKPINLEFRRSNPSIKIDTTNIDDNIEFPAYTEKVIEAYKRIISECIEVSNDKKETPVIELSLYEKGDTIVFSIHHINSSFTKTSKDLLRYGDFFSGIIRHQINGICDWKLRFRHKNHKSYEIHLWSDEHNNEKKSKPVEINNFKGVCFDLIFYRA